MRHNQHLKELVHQREMYLLRKIQFLRVRTPLKAIPQVNLLRRNHGPLAHDDRYLQMAKTLLQFQRLGNFHPRFHKVNSQLNISKFIVVKQIIQIVYMVLLPHFNKQIVFMVLLPHFNKQIVFMVLLPHFNRQIVLMVILLLHVKL